jgi:hypothetical protein
VDTPVFDGVCDELPDKAFAWDLRRQPVRRRLSDAGVLDPGTAIVADCEPDQFRRLTREWPDRAAAEGLVEDMHQLDLERAAQPPVIEVTVTTPPGGIPRADLTRLVSDTVREFTGPQPVLPDEFTVEAPRRGKVLTATRRARRWMSGRTPPVPPDGLPPVPVSEDDTATQEFPAIRPENGFAVTEVRVP